jgi:hypothetical protein
MELRQNNYLLSNEPIIQIDKIEFVLCRHNASTQFPKMGIALKQKILTSCKITQKR